jgi:hypothetical protein
VEKEELSYTFGGHFLKKFKKDFSDPAILLLDIYSKEMISEDIVTLPSLLQQ